MALFQASTKKLKKTGKRGLGKIGLFGRSKKTHKRSFLYR